jgi:sulfur relay protein TusB/DsrH
MPSYPLPDKINNLFLVSRSPFQRPEALLDVELAENGDAVCFIQDGVYAAHKVPDALRAEIESARARGVKFFALTEDLEARGLSSAAGFQEIDYNGLVGLILESTRVIS